MPPQGAAHQKGARVITSQIYLNEDGSVCRGAGTPEDEAPRCDGSCSKWGNVDQMAALYNLCLRYKVPFRFKDYWSYSYEGSGDYMVEGWLGGDTSTIYIGCLPDGSTHS